MCGRYVLFTDEEDDDISEIVRDIQHRLLEEEANEKEGADGRGEVRGAFKAFGEIFPTNIAPVVTSRGPEAMTWGLPPFGQQKNVLINARAETVYEKPTFRQAVLLRRCVVVSHGFYEWGKQPDGGKQKYLFNLSGTNRRLFMAGMYNLYGGWARFTILTTAANASMQPVHNRMPVILLPGECGGYIGDDGVARDIIGRVPPELYMTIA